MTTDPTLPAAFPSQPPNSITGALVRAIRQLPEPEMRRPLLMSLAWTILVFVLLWIVIGWGLDHAFAGNHTVAWIVRILGVLATPILTAILFPSVATGILGLYSEAVIRAVEQRFYPGPPPPPTRWMDQFRSIISLMLLSLVLNLIAIPFYILFPGANLVLFVALNGYLFGRGFFDLVMLRRLDWPTARKLWRFCWLDFTLAGIAVAAVFSIPFANLLAPVIGTAAAVHLAERHLGRDHLARRFA
jgi:CysZ protein